jgi:hypothetical protein
MNASKECFIPGREKRRIPPQYQSSSFTFSLKLAQSRRKYEHLLTQIRERMTQNEQLMAQLEVTKRQPHVYTLTSVRRASPSADLLSPIDSILSDSSTSAPKPDVEEWIAKAPQSFEAFGEFINAGGVGMTKNFSVNEDPENSGGSDDDAYEFALEDEDGETTPIEESLTKTTGTEHDGGYKGTFSASVSGMSIASGLKNKSSNGSENLVILPGGAAPFRLIASLSLVARRRSSDGSAEDDGGVASRDFLKSMFIVIFLVSTFPLTVYSDRSLAGFRKVSHVE